MSDARVQCTSLDIQSESRELIQTHVAQVKRTHEMMQYDATEPIRPINLVQFTVLTFLTCVPVGLMTEVRFCPVTSAFPDMPLEDCYF